MTGKSKLGWGGYRPGAGRKPKPASIKQLNAMLEKGNNWAKKTGYDVDEVLLAVIGDDKKLLGVEDIPLKDRITCAKIWKDFTMSRVTENEHNLNEQPGRLVIGLPEQRPDPAKVVHISQKKKKETK